jgi:hypothetical protein
LCFSLGGDEHPSARESTLLVKNVLDRDRTVWGMTMEIHKSLLAVLLKQTNDTSRLVRPDELWVFDWKTGEKIAVGVISATGD